MASFTQDGIQFTTVLKGQSLPNKYGNGNNGEFADAATDGVEPFINAVEIDWNGAVLPNGNIGNATSVTINSTGDLLKLIDDMQKEIYALSAAVIAIGSQIE